MKSNRLFKRILLMAVLTLIGVGAVVIGMVFYYRQMTLEAEAAVIAWEKAERELYTFSERDLSEEQIEDKCNALCDLYTDEMAEENYRKFYDAASEINAGARTVLCYQRIITDIKVDNRFRETRVYLDCVIDYEGYGPYLTADAEEHLVKREKCSYTIKLEKEGDSFRIADVDIEWENDITDTQ